MVVEACLGEADVGLRCKAVQALGTLKPAALRLHTGALAGRLQSEADPRALRQLLVVLKQLKPADTVHHAPQVLLMLAHADQLVRAAAMQLLGQLGASDRVKAVNELSSSAPAVSNASVFAQCIAADGGDGHASVRRAALAALAEAGEAALRQHVQTILHRLEDEDNDVRCSALETLGRLSSQQLAQHVQAVGQLLLVPAVQLAALSTLGKLLPQQVPSVISIVSQVSSLLSEKQHEAEPEVRKAARSLFTAEVVTALLTQQHATALLTQQHAVSWLTFFGTEPLLAVQHAGLVVQHCLEGRAADGAVRCAGIKMLGTLEPESLAQHVTPIASRLADSDEVVRDAAVTALEKLDESVLASHADAFAVPLQSPDQAVLDAVTRGLRPLVISRLLEQRCGQPRVRSIRSHTPLIAAPRRCTAWLPFL